MFNLKITIMFYLGILTGIVILVIIDLLVKMYIKYKHYGITDF